MSDIKKDKIADEIDRLLGREINTTHSQFNRIIKQSLIEAVEKWNRIKHPTDPEIHNVTLAFLLKELGL